VYECVVYDEQCCAVLYCVYFSACMYCVKGCRCRCVFVCVIGEQITIVRILCSQRCYRRVMTYLLGLRCGLTAEHFPIHTRYYRSS